jgi:hypothetical protein
VAIEVFAGACILRRAATAAKGSQRDRNEKQSSAIHLMEGARDLESARRLSRRF